MLRGAFPGCTQLPLGFALLLALLASSPALGPDAHAAHAFDDPRLAQAQERYEQANYDGALALLEALAADSSLPPETQRATYQLLGKVYTVVGRHDEARATIRRWIAMEPPVVQPDPNRDMLQFVQLYYEVRRALNEEHLCPSDFQPPHPCQFGIERPDPGIQTIALLDFDNNAIDERERLAPLRSGLADVMVRQLSGTTGLRIVERERLNWLMEEIQLNQSGRVDPETALRIGRLLGAHAVLLGDYLYFDRQLIVGARLVKVETGEILLTASEEGKLQDFTKLTGRLSEQLARAMGTRIQRGEWEGRTPTNELDAMLAYATGLELYNAGAYEAASEKFREALAHDPDHELAQQKYESLQPMLASVE